MGFDPISYILGAKSGGGGGGGGVTVEALTVTENGTTTAPEGKAYSPVSVDVPNSYAAGDEGKVVSNGALVSQTAHATVTQNGTVDTTLNNSVTVAVPQPDPYLYENVYTLNLSKTANTWTGGPTITIDCAKIGTMTNMCNGGGNNPGYRIVKLKNIPTSAIVCTTAFTGHGATSSFDTLELDGNLVFSGSAQGAFYNNRSIKHVTGGAIDLSAATNLTNFAAQAWALETISFVPSSIKLSITFAGAESLSDDSLVSIVNGLDGTVTGQSLTLHATPKARCGQIVGTVTDGIFAIDAGGSTTLLDFATTTKGWTVA